MATETLEKTRDTEATKRVEQVIRNMQRRKYQRLAQMDYSNEGIELFNENQFAHDLGVSVSALETVIPIRRHESLFGGKGVMWRPTDEEMRKAIPKLTEYIEGTTKTKPTKSPTKEPWQMTREEYFTEGKQQAELYRKGISTVPDSGKYNTSYHRESIKQALSEGKPVPAEVLKDYPELGQGTPEKKVKPHEAFQERDFKSINEFKDKGEFLEHIKPQLKEVKHPYVGGSTTVRPYVVGYGCDGSTDANIHYVAQKLAKDLGWDYAAIEEIQELLGNFEQIESSP